MPRARILAAGSLAAGIIACLLPLVLAAAQPAIRAEQVPPPQGPPAQQDRPAPGAPSKPIPEEELHCRPRLSAERRAALTRAGALATATAAWEASALALHGPGFRWSSARDQSTNCSLGLGWSCTLSARPCRG